MFKKIILWVRRFFITILSIVIVIYSVSYLYKKPDIGQGHYIKLYDSSSNVFYSSNTKSNDVSLKDVSTYFIASLVAVEDHRFYDHLGFDMIGILRAIKVNVTHNAKSEGASTITQQYARLLYFNNEKTWSRKIKEALMTVRLEAHYSKEEILTGYVNTVYFGHGVYGIKNAAMYYFNKDPKDLDLNESSMLAGVINAPAYYSPFVSIQKAKARQEVVLNRLVEEKYISEELKEKTLQTAFQLNENPSLSSTTYQYYKDTVIDELEELGFYTDNYINQGLNIYTSFDVNIQNELDQCVETQMKDQNELEIAEMITSVDNASIVALRGGKDYSSSQFNRATDAKRQVASTIKPLLYYLAIENGFSATTKFKSEQTTFKLENGTTYSPTNFNNKYANDDITLAQAIATSDNIYAVKTHLFLGEQTLVNLLSKFNINHVTPNPSLALGTFNSNIYTMSNIYTTFANTGIYNQIHTIEKIVNDDGKILYQRQYENEQKLNEDSCLILSQLLQSPFLSVFKTYASPTMMNYQTKYQYAVKSGTSPYDSLCIGYNPKYVIAGWVGYDDNRELSGITKTRIPKLIFQHMANYLVDNDCWYDLDDHIQAVPINPVTGEYDENGTIYWFKQ
jgi:membrane peptidoglycan carboxypeptidase